MIGLNQFLFVRSSAFFLWAVLVFPLSAGQAAGPETGGEPALLARYPAIRAKLEKNQFGAPIYLESAEAEGSLAVDMYGIFNHPFAALSDALQSPANWCDITPLHINIKACTSGRADGQWLLTLYSGRKYYQPPADAYPLKLKFHIVAQRPDYLDVTLAADEGPLRTKDHRIRLEAAPLDTERSLVHFSCSYSHGLVARMAIRIYFATLARDKVGFTIIAGKGGKPVYIGGVRGAIERNAIRYYLAVEAYLDTLGFPEEQRFERRIGRWYDLTARYPRQLKEMEKEEYIAVKRREHINQLALQKKEG